MKAKALLVLLLLCLGLSLPAQIIDVKEKIRSKTIDRADQRTDQGIDKGLDKIEEGVVGAFKGKNKDKDNEEENTEDEDNNDAEENKSTDQKSAKKQETAKLESYTKYDFVPGDQLIIFEDFSQDAIGDFPALWTTNGSGEVRTLNNYPGNWFYLNSEDNVYNLMKDFSLPDNFILEFDVVAAPKEDSYNHSSFYLTLYNDDGDFLNDRLYPGTGGVHITCSDENWGVQSYAEEADGIDGNSTLAPLDVNKLNHVIIWVQKRRLRIYHKGQKVVDLPTVLYSQVKYNRLRFSLWGQSGFPYITNIRFTSAAPDTRSKLLTEGKLVSYGIYFDVNKDVVKPESYGSLNEIAKVLKENPDVKIKIVGHTDGDGDAAKNLDLSKRRAASVKNELAKTFGIDSGRIETDGAGETQPVAGNDTPENKAKNRRVEFIKL
ncbi:MAG: OmpA family protein [Bacteroidales bacterium]|nr:OmpA family protein [Bacteroidales bacterium]